MIIWISVPIRNIFTKIEDELGIIIILLYIVIMSHFPNEGFYFFPRGSKTRMGTSELVVKFIGRNFLQLRRHHTNN